MQNYLNSDVKAYDESKFNLNIYFFLQFGDWMLQKIEKIIRENVFEQKKKKPGLKFNPEFALISFQTNGPWS